jgi:hypothetical protein
MLGPVPHGVQSKTDASKVLKFGCHGGVLPISVNRLTFIILREDKCVETAYEMLISMTLLFLNGCSGRVILILESVNGLIGERTDASSNIGDSGLIECLE